MKTQRKYRKTIETGQAIAQSVCVNIDGLQPLIGVMRNGFLVAIFLILGFTANAKPKYFGPSFGYHHHHYVYYPKQNFYYDPFVGTYVVYERGIWVRRLEPPHLLTKININILPHVDVYVDSYYPQRYNHEHRHTYRLIYLVAPSTTFYVFRMPHRYDFTITPYAYSRPPRHIVYYNPNYYCHRNKYPGEHRGHGNGHAYGHYKHRPHYGYDGPYGHHGAKQHHKNNGGPGFGGVGNPQKAKSNKHQQPAPFGAKPNKKGNNQRPFGTMPQNKKSGPANGKPSSPAHPSKQKQGHGGKKNFSEVAHPEQNNGNMQKPGGNKNQNMPQQGPISNPNRQVSQKQEQRPAGNQKVKQQERNVQYSQKSMPNENRGGAAPQPRTSKGGKGRGKG